MHELEQVLWLFAAAVALAGVARRVGAPYPVFLAIGGALLTLVPSASSFTLPPDLVLALFVAPVLLDAAYDASLRDLQENWIPVAGLVVLAVGLTTLAVAIVARALVPGLAWAPAIALGAVVAPPDAVAASAVLRPMRPPHRILTILEGESLLNDASALLIFRLAVAAAVSGTFTASAVAPAFLLAVGGSAVVGPALGWVVLHVLGRIAHFPTAIIMQFVSTIGVWLLAERLGLSGVLTMVCYAITVAQTAPERTPARVRLPTYAVWETVVFALNILAFIFIGLQLGPILGSFDPDLRRRYLAVAAAVVATVIVVRLAWQFVFSTVAQAWYRRTGYTPPRPMLRPSYQAAFVVGWAGMRGIVSLAAAMALPAGFPFRDLMLVTAFSVVLATLVIQGLTLKPLMRLLDLRDDDPVGLETAAARQRALDAALASLAGNTTADADAARHVVLAHLADRDDADAVDADGAAVHVLSRHAAAAARREVLAMRSRREIGDDAFHRVEESLDWLDMTSRTDA